MFSLEPLGLVLFLDCAGYTAELWSGVCGRVGFVQVVSLFFPSSSVPKREKLTGRSMLHEAIILYFSSLCLKFTVTAFAGAVWSC